MIGNIDKLVELSLMQDEYRNTWVSSLFDLMAIADFCTDEDEFIDYLNLRYDINNRGIVYMDELDLYDQFINNDLKRKLLQKNIGIIQGNTGFFNKEYSNIPIQPQVKP